MCLRGLKKCSFSMFTQYTQDFLWAIQKWMKKMNLFGIPLPSPS